MILKSQRFEEIKKHLTATHTMDFKNCGFCDTIKYAEELERLIEMYQDSACMLQTKFRIAMEALKSIHEFDDNLDFDEFALNAATEALIKIDKV